ncbi:DUF2312 domain-containing protein [Maricaulis sp.]|jgi:uncharacterized protein (UPF0335 family)|uniref:DUF2312 domain-containing protein n=1 Tax=Maricaulis TaxID=74317 RepID=UPI0025E64D55|nr:DUF2312 domain-containing protein [Maricaulis sp.]MDF1768101.1 DUF2312 domain-containing protein [Maricaulis sp.]
MAFTDTAPQTQRDESDAIGGAAREQLKAFVARIERLEEDKANVMADMKEVYAEAKSSGYDTKILRKVIALRKIDRHERQEAEALLELYLGAVEG